MWYWYLRGSKYLILRFCYFGYSWLHTRPLENKKRRRDILCKVNQNFQVLNKNLVVPQWTCSWLFQLMLQFFFLSWHRTIQIFRYFHLRLSTSMCFIKAGIKMLFNFCSRKTSLSGNQGLDVHWVFTSLVPDYCNWHPLESQTCNG